jgi:hypothetical protein
MALLAKLQENGKEPLSRIWKWLVDYANADNSRRDFRYLVRAGFQNMGIVGGVPKILRESKDIKAGASMSDLEERYRQPIREVLEWIARPKFSGELTDELAYIYIKQHTQAAQFLLDSAQSAKIQILVGAEISPEGEISIEQERAVTKSDSIVAGICQFILRQIDRHELDGEPLSEIFPFAMCERQGCGQFHIVQRSGRSRFCSDACRTKFNASKRTKQENAERMRKYRSEQKKREKKGLDAVMAEGTKKGGK